MLETDRNQTVIRPGAKSKKSSLFRRNRQLVKVIWRKTASPPHTDGSALFARWRQCDPSKTPKFIRSVPVLPPAESLRPSDMSWTGLLAVKMPLHLWGSGPPWFLGPIPDHIPNGISMGSAVVAGFTVMTDRQTDRPRYSVSSNMPHMLRCGPKLLEAKKWNLFHRKRNRNETNRNAVTRNWLWKLICEFQEF